MKLATATQATMMCRNALLHGYDHQEMGRGHKGKRRLAKRRERRDWRTGVANDIEQEIAEIEAEDDDFYGI